jgi:hypothetical protein
MRYPHLSQERLRKAVSPPDQGFGEGVYALEAQRDNNCSSPGIEDFPCHSSPKVNLQC